MIFESHAHYDDEQFEEDRDTLLQSMKEHGIDKIINVGAALESLPKVMKLTETYSFVYAALGIHPDEVGDLNEETFKTLSDLCKREKVVAVGEIGLDYYWDNQPRETQKKWFIRQLDLARELHLPVIIHSRDAASDTMEIMKEHAREMTGVIHCFSYSIEQAREYIKMGYYIGIGGVVTFKNAKKLKEIAASIPLSSILLETDCPYLAPVPNRGKRNSSLNIPFIAQEIAELKGITYEEVVEETRKNAEKLFGV